jgi:hypothetical protein
MAHTRLNPRRAKLHRSYTVEETARLFGVHRNTVRAWLKQGLKWSGQDLLLLRRRALDAHYPELLAECCGCHVPRMRAWFQLRGLVRGFVFGNGPVRLLLPFHVPPPLQFSRHSVGRQCGLGNLFVPGRVTAIRPPAQHRSPRESDRQLPQAVGSVCSFRSNQLLTLAKTGVSATDVLRWPHATGPSPAGSSPRRLPEHPLTRKGLGEPS